MTPRDELIDEIAFKYADGLYSAAKLKDALRDFAARSDAQDERRKGERRSQKNGGINDREVKFRNLLYADRRKQDAAQTDHKGRPMTYWGGMEDKAALISAPDAETPETDKVCNDAPEDDCAEGYSMMRAHARQMERQRDAAVRERDSLRDDFAHERDRNLQNVKAARLAQIAAESRVRGLDARIESLAKDAEKYENTLKHILWIKDGGVDGLNEKGELVNFPAAERDAMYRIAKEALMKPKADASANTVAK